MSELESINWRAPWLVPYKAIGERLSEALALGTSVHKALNAVAVENLCPVRFVAQTELPTDIAYESFVYESKQVPTRENLHDFFNALVWLTFPQIKSRLNALQAEAIADSGGVGQHRGKLRDALTLMDENGAVLTAPAALQAALVNKDWQTLFVQERHLWAQSELVIVGHALLEKLVIPRKPMCAHVYLANSLSDLGLTAQRLAQKPFYPLPVLGVPGWWKANEDSSFYADPAVFRVYPPALRVDPPALQGSTSQLAFAPTK